ncbi:MAG: dynamin family protein [Candidatus Nanopelagicales bacterium]
MRDLLARLDPRRRPAGPTLDAAALDARLAGLDAATRVATGRLPSQAVLAAHETMARAGARREFSAELTVVAFAGSTGAGKSTLFNAIVGAEVARTGVLRPTTSEPMAAIWGDSPAVSPLLDWLGVSNSHRVGAEAADGPSEVEAGEPQARAATPEPSELDGLVLIDLPDHDSTQATHRAHVDRLVERVDVMIWVLDPQKYADAMVHDQYLKRFARHSDVTVVLLNQVDKLAPGEVEACLGSLRQLLVEDGLGSARVIATSSHSGQGLAELGGLLGDAAAQRRASLARVAADVASAADRLAACANDEGKALPVVSRERLDALAGALTDAAGVAVITDAVRESVARSGRRRTGWPITRWVTGLRKDPIKKLRLDLSSPAALAGTRMPSGDPVALARATEAIRGYAARASVGAPEAWVRSTRAVAMGTVDDLIPALDSAVVRAEVGRPKQPKWWAAVGALQWLFLIVAATGALWLLGLAGMSFAALPPPETPLVGGLPVPTVMLVGGLLIGLVIAVMTGLLVRNSAERAAKSARAAVAESVAQVARTHVVEPIDAELATLSDFRIGLLAARGDA